MAAAKVLICITRDRASLLGGGAADPPCSPYLHHGGAATDDTCGHRTALASSGSLLPNGIAPNQHKAEHHSNSNKSTTNMYKRIPSTSPLPTPAGEADGSGRDRAGPPASPGRLSIRFFYCSERSRKRSRLASHPSMAALVAYWLAEHPDIVGFRWSPSGLWFSTWALLLGFLAAYVSLCLAADALLGALLRRRRPLPLGPLPAAHALLMAAVSATIFAGTLLSAVAEIRDTRWSWRGRSRTTPFRWLLCFPPGTRSSGRVFFWSYAYYLHAARGAFAVLRRRRGAAARVFAHAASVAMAFLWLEFSQSFQVLAILASTLAHAVAFGFRFWVDSAARSGSAPVALACQLGLLGCNLVCHAGVVWMHFGGAVAGGCSGIGAWVFNTLLNAALLWVFLHCYGTRGVCDDDGGATAATGALKKEKEM